MKINCFHKIFLILFCLFFSVVQPLLAQKSKITQKNLSRKSKNKKSKNTKNKTKGESINKKYNINGPRPEATKGGVKKVDLSKEKIVKKEKEQLAGKDDYGYTDHMPINEAATSVVNPVKARHTKETYKNKAQVVNKGEGDTEQREKISGNEFDNAITHPVKQRHTKESYKAKATEANKGEGDTEQREKISGNEFDNAITHPVKQRHTKESYKAKAREANKGQGDQDIYDRRKANEFDNVIIQPKIIKVTEEVVKANSAAAAGSKGDMDMHYRYGANTEQIIVPPSIAVVDKSKETSKQKSIEAATSKGDMDMHYRYGANTEQIIVPPSIAVVDQSRAIRKQKSIEAGASQGDVDARIHFWRGFLESEIGIISANDEGVIDREVLYNQAAQRKSLNREISSNVGDIVGGLDKKKAIEKENAQKVATYKGTFNADLLQAQKDREKSLDREINTYSGDMVGGLDKKKAIEKENTQKVAAYKGTFNADLLQAQKDKEIALDRQLKTYTGDIATTSLASKKATMRAKSRKMTWYEGDIVVSTKIKSNHPSAVYVGGKIKGSNEEKEKYRKRMVRKARKHRDTEDPVYMRKEAPKPRFETGEYKIWELKSREGDPDPFRPEKKDMLLNDKKDKLQEEEKEATPAPAEEKKEKPD